MATLERAIAIAAEAHTGQVDKAGEPYILHVLRVVAATKTPEARIVAALHDVVEDTDWALDGLAKEGFGNAVLEALDCVTRRKGESYDAFIVRIAENPLAREVKLFDLSVATALRLTR